MLIRKAEKKDIRGIAILEEKRFPAPWTYPQWMYDFEENSFSFINVIEDEGKIVGYIDFWILFEEAQICKICVDEEYSHQGLGDKLLKDALKKIDEELCISTTLEVRVHNENAVKLYTKNKFKTVCVKEHYYSNGEDAYYMMRSIGDIYEG